MYVAVVICTYNTHNEHTHIVGLHIVLQMCIILTFLFHLTEYWVAVLVVIENMVWTIAEVMSQLLNISCGCVHFNSTTCTHSEPFDYGRSENSLEVLVVLNDFLKTCPVAFNTVVCAFNLLYHSSPSWNLRTNITVD